MIIKKSNSAVIRWLLLAGVISTPLFYIAAIIQTFTRAGFDIRRAVLDSLLSAGFRLSPQNCVQRLFKYKSKERSTYEIYDDCKSNNRFGGRGYA